MKRKYKDQLPDDLHDKSQAHIAALIGISQGALSRRLNSGFYRGKDVLSSAKHGLAPGLKKLLPGKLTFDTW